MLARFVEILFGCRHGNCTFPMTLKAGRRRGNASPAGAYVVCLDCGRELAYDWVNMRVTATRTPNASVAISRTSAERVAA